MSQSRQVEAPKFTHPWVLLVLLLGIALFYYADRYLISGLVEPIKAEFGVGDSFMGRLMGPAFAIFTALLAIPFARVADRRTYVGVVCAGCLFWSVCTVATGFATEPWMLVAARIGVGVGEAAFSAPAYALVALRFPPERRTFALTVLGVSTYFGQGLGYGLGPTISEQHGWRAAFLWVGAAGAALGALAWLVLREPPRTQVADAEATPFWPLLFRFFRRPSFAFATAGMSLGVLSGIAFGFWGPSLMARAFELTQKEASGAFGLYFGLPGIAGMLIFGALGDALLKRSARWLFMLAGISLLGATSAILAVTWATDFTFAKLIAIGAGFVGGGWSVGVIASLQYLLPQRTRATGTAIVSMMIVLIGYVLGPSIAGDVSEALGGSAQGLRIGLSAAILAGVPGALCLLLAARTLEQDRAVLADGDAAA